MPQDVNTITRRLALPALLFALSLPALSAAPQGRQILVDMHADQVSPELDRQMVEAVDHNLQMLEREGRLPPKSTAKVSGLVWPMGPGSGEGAEWHATSGYVDLNPAYPGAVRDYTCGTRTYDTAAGYNHRGIDYIPWPFPWHSMDTAPVDVRATAAGVLVEKRDGASDRSCNWNGPDNANYVIIRHADATIARYLHLKRGTVTVRPIGSQIAAGEVIGKVGSSGISKVPHLHLELRASNLVNAAVIEPHQGACNTSSSTWANQRPYREPLLSRLSTHSGEPHYPTCPDTTEIPHFADRFQPGQAATFLAAYRDVRQGQVSQFRIFDANGAQFASWSLDTANEPEITTDYVTAAYWTWTHVLPADAPPGLWTYEAQFEGKTSRHHFRVGNTTPIGDMRGLVGAWYEPATSGQGFELHWINDEIALLFFYGHHDDGRNFFVLGQRNGRFDFGQEVVFDLYQTLGGRFNGLDPDQIERPAWGQARITFVSCETAVAELEGVDGTQVLNLERLGRTEGLDCQ